MYLSNIRFNTILSEQVFPWIVLHVKNVFHFSTTKLFLKEREAKGWVEEERERWFSLDLECDSAGQ